jgi:NAD(P)-dependent dehydrogenase (short-subunit alcohol dehydrogenase family)
LARELAASGARLVLAARGAERLEALAAALGARAEAVDALDPVAVDALVARTVAAEGRIDGVAVCVGSILLKPLHSTTDEDFRATYERNVLPAFHVARAAVRAMQSGGGSIVLLSSVASGAGLANHEAISAAKGAVAALARSAAATYAHKRIRVNAVAPGLVRTPLAERITSSATALAASVAMHPLGRIGEPGDVARLVAFLLDPRNDWITGQVVGVDGGLATLRTR